MTEEQLRRMSEQQIRARFRCAPAYYLQAKLETKRGLESPAEKAAPVAERHWQANLPEQPQAPAGHSEPEGPEAGLRAPWSLDIALPEFEILDATLAATLAEFVHPEPGPYANPDPEHTQQAILEAALEDYSNWPLLPGPELAAEQAPAPGPKAESDLERELERVLASTPELIVVLESEPDLTLVPEPEPAVIPESRPAIAPPPIPDNVTRADFGRRAVRVVSVVMDRKRPNMVRVVGKTTRRAS